MTNFFAHKTSQGLGAMLRGTETMSGNLSRHELSLSSDGTLKLRSFVDKLRPWRSLTTAALRKAIKTDAKELAKRLSATDRLPANAAKRITASAIAYLKNRGPVTLANLRVVDSLLRMGFGQDGRIDFKVATDSDRGDIDACFDEIFGDYRLDDKIKRGDDGIAKFKKIATAALGGTWDAEITKATDPDHRGMIKVAFTETNEKDEKDKFEFFFGKTEWRENSTEETISHWGILCGDDFAERAARGDPRMKQVKDMLTELVQSSRRLVLERGGASDGGLALDRAVFKVPEKIDVYSLLSHGYGASSQRQIIRFIVKMVDIFKQKRGYFEAAMNETDVGKAAETIDKVLARLDLSMDGLKYAFLAPKVAAIGNDRERDLLQEGFVVDIEENCKDLMEIVNIDLLVDLEKLRGDPDIGPLVPRNTHQQQGKVPLGPLLVKSVPLGQRVFDVVCAPAKAAFPEQNQSQTLNTVVSAVWVAEKPIGEGHAPIGNA